MPRTVWARAEDGAWARVAVRGDVFEVLDVYWPPRGLEQYATDPGADDVFVCDVDTNSVHSLAQLESELGLFAAEHLVSRVAVHAALIQLGSAVVMLPGTSRSGKSSLCAAALDAGVVVLSDEYAVVNPVDGTVEGWPRPVRVRREDGWDRRGGVTSTGPMPVALVAGLTYAADPANTAPLSIEPCEVGALTMLLLANTVCASSQPDRALDAALAVARRARGVIGMRGEASAALAALAQLARG